MASSVKDLLIRLLVDDNEIEKIDRAGDRTGKAGSQIRASFEGGAGALSKFSALSGAVAGGVASIATKALDWVGSFAGEVATAADSTIKFQQTMSFAGIDNTAIKAITEDTRAYANATVYDLATVQNTTAQLAANGIPNYEKLTEAAGNLNAVAGGNADTFKSVSMVLTQTAGQGKLTTENWNQLSDAIPGASGKLQEALLKAGAYTGNFRTAMEKGEISADEFNAALMQVGTEPIAVEAAKSTSTLEGAVGNLQATVVGGLSDMLSKAQPLITGAIGWISDKLGVFLGWAGGAFSGLLDLVLRGDFTAAFRQAFNVEEDSPVVDVILNIRQSVIDLATRIPQIIGGIVNWVKDNATWLAPLLVGLAAGVVVVKAWQGALALWTTATKVAAAAQAVFNMVLNANPIMLVITAIVALVAGLVWFFTQTKLGQEVWQNVTQAIGAAVNWLWSSVIQPVFTFIGAIFTWVYQNVVLPVVTAIMIYIGLWAAAITWMWESVLSPVFQAIGAIFTWIYQNVIVPIVDGIVLAIRGWGVIFTWLNETIVQPVFRAVGSAFQWVWNSVISPVVNFIGDAIRNVGNTVQSVFGGIGSFIGSAFQTALNVVRGPINGIIGLVNSAISGLNSLSVTIPSWVPIVGGQTWGLNIPQIPYLATGGITYGPTLAVIGDNPGGREVVQPLSTAQNELRRAYTAGQMTAPARSGPLELSDSSLRKLGQIVIDGINRGGTKAVLDSL